MSKGKFVVKESNGVQYFVFSHLEETGLVVHGITTRHRGVSQPPYDSLNLAFHTGDDPDNVRENRRIVSTALGFDVNGIISAQQVHGVQVCEVTSKQRGCGSLEYGTSITDTDGLFTREPGVPLVMNYADCVPVFILDPIKKAVCLCHAGWRGTVDGIVRKSLRKMVEKIGTCSEHCLVGIGPSIGPCCYEVDTKVVQPLSQRFPNYEQFVHSKGEEKWMLDLWELNRWQLMQEGVKQENIVISGMCTHCWSRLFFSHRGSGGTTGRIAALCLLK